MNFGLFQGTKPLLVVVEPNPGSGEMKQAMYELNTRMPRKVRATEGHAVLLCSLARIYDTWLRGARVTNSTTKTKLTIVSTWRDKPSVNA